MPQTGETNKKKSRKERKKKPSTSRNKWKKI